MPRIKKGERMSSRIFFWIAAVSVGLIRSSAGISPLAAASGSLHWASDAKLNRFPKSTRGSLAISTEGIDFHPAKGEPIHWAVEDIRTVELFNPRKLSLVTYQNRRWHVPGDRPFVFDLQNSMPPELAGELVRLVGKPAINGVPAAHASGLATIGARHPTRTGGSNGVLRFRDGGIDYLAAKGNDSRSWRWADIQTVAHPEPYRLRIAGYLETFDFELKQPLPDNLFDRLWDHLYARGLNIGEREGEAHAEIH
jgi:hypothetical protein